MNHIFRLCAFIIVLLGFGNVANAQTIKLEGIIGMEGGELYGYDVTASSTGKPNEYKGIARTHVFKGHEFRVEVIFTVNTKDNSMDFRETRIMDETGFKENVTVCLVEAHLKYDPATGVLKGDINKDVENKASYCAIGKLTFMNKNGLDPIFNPKNDPIAATTPAATEVTHTPPPSKSTASNGPKMEVVKREEEKVNDVRKSQPVVVRKKTDPNAPKQVTDGKAITINWESETIVLEIWDDNNIDHDIVTIVYNNKEVLSDYVLTKEPKKIQLPISGSELNIITIKAMNNGGEPPNTATLRLYDGNKEHKVVAHNDAGKSAIIRILKNIK